jgi:hypothetical protein
METNGGKPFKRAGGEHPPAIEVYVGGRYFTVTDDEIGDYSALREISFEDLYWLIKEYGPEFVGNGHAAQSNYSKDNSRSAKAFRRMQELKAMGWDYAACRDALLASPDPEIKAWANEKGLASGERQLKRAYENGKASAGANISLDDFYAHLPSHSYIFVPSRDMWPAGSVNACLKPIPIGRKNGKEGEIEKTISAATWLDSNKPVHQMTWVPGKPMIITNKLIADGGWIEREGLDCFNLYRPPTIIAGDAKEAERWVDHVNTVYPNDAEHNPMVGA